MKTPLVHYVMVAGSQVERWPKLVVLLCLGVAAALPALLWRPVDTAVQEIVGGAQLGFSLVDWGLLSLLPRLGRSWGPVKPPLLGLAILRAIVSILARPLLLLSVPLAIAGQLLGQTVVTILQIRATWIAPFQLGVTHIRLPTHIAGQRPVRLLHLADLHVERFGPREAMLQHWITRLDPDIIVFTGDVLNLSYNRDPQAIEAAKQVMRCWKAPYGVFAISGTDRVDLPDVLPRIYNDLPHITWLRDQTVPVNVGGMHLWILGAECSHSRSQDLPRLARLWQAPSGDEKLFRILLYHSPDLAPEAAAAGIDLYLAGHTHGGQFRFPVIGALYTGSEFFKRFEVGLHRLNGMILYVSRGIGMEGLSVPRARLNCAPEITLFTLVPQEERRENEAGGTEEPEETSLSSVP